MYTRDHLLINSKVNPTLLLKISKFFLNQKKNDVLVNYKCILFIPFFYFRGCEEGWVSVRNDRSGRKDDWTE